MHVTQSQDSQSVSSWVQSARLSDAYVDCITAVMLKILDGKCKMGKFEINYLISVYEVTRFRDSYMFPASIHILIDKAMYDNSAFKNEIHQLRIYAERVISKPTMKKFKKMMFKFIREAEE